MLETRQARGPPSSPPGPGWSPPPVTRTDMKRLGQRRVPPTYASFVKVLDVVQGHGGAGVAPGRLWALTTARLLAPVKGPPARAPK